MRVIATHSKVVDSNYNSLIRWKSREVLNDVEIVLLGFDLWIDLVKMHLCGNLPMFHAKSHFNQSSDARSRFGMT